MGKIQKTVREKYGVHVSEYVDNFIETLATLPLHQIPAHLATFPTPWPFPRGDLHNWIPVLNRFDDILERFTVVYGLDHGPQTIPFGCDMILEGGEPEKLQDTQTPVELRLSEQGDVELVEHIVNFTRLLLENCGNRSLYASSDHLNKLLNTTSLTLLEATLRLTFRLAQRYLTSRMRGSGSHHVPSVSQGMLKSHYLISLDTVEQIAQPFVKNLNDTNDRGSTLKSTEKGTVASPSYCTDLLSLLHESDDEENEYAALYGQAWLNYLDSDEASVTLPDSPTKPRSSPLASEEATRNDGAGIEGEITAGSTAKRTVSTSHPTMKLLEVAVPELASLSPELANAKYLPRVPESLRYSLFNRIRTSKALSQSRSSREIIITIRLLAIANLAYIYPESQLQGKIFQHEAELPRRSQLPYQLSSLIHGAGVEDGLVPKSLQTVAIMVLESLTNHSHKHSEICTVLSVGANHGTLTYTLRRAVADMASEVDEKIVDVEWFEAVYALLHNLPKTNSRVSDSFVQAGMVDIMVEALSLRTPKAVRYHPPILNFLDVFVFNTRDAMNALVTAKGFDALSELLAKVVEDSFSAAVAGNGVPTSYRSQAIDFSIALLHQQTLRALLKFIKNRLGNSTGQHERMLRNLVESSPLLGGLNTIMSNTTMFGSSLWTVAIEIFSTFINNEPTSYAAIAEAGLTTAFLGSITRQPDRAVPVVEETGMSDTLFEAPISEPKARTDRGSHYAICTSDQAADGVPLSVEAIAAIPQAFSAICLNESGMKQFEESRALDAFFRAFRSPKHLKLLSTIGTRALEQLGSQIDELARHHPPLRSKIIEGVFRMSVFAAATSFQRCKKHYAEPELCLWDFNSLPMSDSLVANAEMPYGLMSLRHLKVFDQTPKGETSKDVEMSDVSNGDNTIPANGPSALQSNPASSNTMGNTQPDMLDQHKASYPTDREYTTVFAYFLGGFFTNHSLITPFADNVNGIESIIDIVTSPSLPTNFNNHAYNRLFRLLSVFIEHKPHTAIPLLINRATDVIKYLDTFLDYPAEDSFFSIFWKPTTTEFTDLQKSVEGKGAMTLRMLTAVESICRLLEQSFRQQPPRSSSHPLSNVNFADSWTKLIDALGKIQAKSIWESILVEAALPESLKKGGSTNGPASDSSAVVMPRIQEVMHAIRIAHGEIIESQQAHTQPSGHDVSEGATKTSALRDNIGYAIFHQLTQLPCAISNFLATFGKVILTRRLPPDAYQRQNTIAVADHIGAAASNLLSSPTQAAQVSALIKFKATALKFVSASVWDQRTDRPDRIGPQVLTLILVAFKANNGFERLLDMANSLQRECESNEVSRDVGINDETSSVLAAQALATLVTLLSHITTHKAFIEAPQTISLSSRSSSNDKPEIFSSPHFEVDLKILALRVVIPLWNSETIEKVKAIVPRVCRILQNTLDVSGEDLATQPVKLQPFNRQQDRVQWKERSADAFQKLAGPDGLFEKDIAFEALYRCYGNYLPAHDYCTQYLRDPMRPHNMPPDYDVASDTPSKIANETPSGANNGDGQQAAAENERETNGDRAMDDAGQADDRQDDSNLMMSVLEHAEELDEAEPTAGRDSRTPTVVERAVSPPDQNSSSDTPTTDGSRLQNLIDRRSSIREDLVGRCLVVLSAWPGLAFEIADLILSAIQKSPEPSHMREEVTLTLTQSIISLQTEENIKKQTDEVAAQAHLLGLLLQNKEIYEAAKEQLQSDFSTLLDFVKVMPGQDPSSLSTGVIGPILLVLECVLTEDAQPQQIKWNIDNPKEPPIEALTAPKASMISQEDKQLLFSRLLDIMPLIGKDAKLGVYIMRVLVLLTRTRGIALQLGQKRNMQRLFVMVKQVSTKADARFHSALMLTLRNVVEDDASLYQIISNSVKDLFGHRTNSRRVVDLATYTKNLSHLLLRAPYMFVDVTNELLMLQKPAIPYNLALKTDLPPIKADVAGEKSREDSETSAVATSNDTVQPSMETDQSQNKAKSSEFRPPVVENPDGVIHFLLSELLAYKDVTDKEPQLNLNTHEKAQAQGVSAHEVIQPSVFLDTTKISQDNSQPSNPDDYPLHIYRCILLRCLTELLQSYNRTKVEFINFSRKADPQAATPTKPRSGVLNYLLHALIPKTSTSEAIDHKKQRLTDNESDCAIQCVVSLCSRTSEKGPIKSRESSDQEDEPDLAFVRRFVLEHALKVYKDVGSSSETLEKRYSYLLSIADLFNRMLAGQPMALPSRYSRNDSGEDNFVPSRKQLAKIMYEKGFIPALTSSVSDVDLAHPGASRVVKYILRPLKLLTHTAIDLSLSSDASTTPGQTDEEEISSATSVSEAADEREETPDLYRNSTLGIFEPGRDAASDLSSPEQEEGEAVYADDMEFEDEDEEDPESVPEEGSDDDSDSDSDEDMEEVGDIEGLHDDVGIVELAIEGSEDEEDLDGNEEDEEGEEDGDDSDDDLLDEEEEDEDQELEVMEEITGDDENDSLGDEMDENINGGHGPSMGYIDSSDHDHTFRLAAGDHDNGSEPDLDHYVITNPLGNENVDTDLLAGDDEDEDVDEDSQSEDVFEEDDEYDEDEAMGFDDPDFGDDDAESSPFHEGMMYHARRHLPRIEWGQWSSFERPSGLGIPSTQQPPVPRMSDDGQNPLLRRENPRYTGPSLARPVSRRTQPQPFALIPPSIREELGRLFRGGGRHATSYLEHVLGDASMHVQPTMHNGELTLTLGNTHSATPHHHHHTHRHDFTEQSRTILTGAQRDDSSLAIVFEPSTTEHRWKEAGRLVFGSSGAECSQRVTNMVLRHLFPPAQEEHETRIKEQQAQVKKVAEEARLRDEEEAKAKKEEEDRQAREAEEKAAAEAEEAARLAAEQGSMTATNQTDEAVQTHAMEGVETTEQPATSPQEEHASTEPRNKIFTTIRGRDLDITDLGIDATYLEALPEDMREEVIMQQYAEQRSQAAASGAPPTSIDTEFLDALPPDMRHELLQQEAADRRRAEREEARRQAQSQGASARAEDMDNASFLATLDPLLRQTVLADTEDEVLEALGPEYVAEARASGGHHRRHRAFDTAGALFGGLGLPQGSRASRARGPEGAEDAEESKPPRRPIIQMLDKAGVATLLRLMFVPTVGHSRSTLNGILRNVSGNRQTRGEVINGILTILQDGSADVGAVEKCFAHLSLRAKQANAQKTPQTDKKSSDVVSSLTSEASPSAVIGRCLNALTFLTNSLTHIPQFFLTEHEVAGAKTKSSRKGKARDVKVIKYPLVTLLSLLDRDVVINNVSVMEQLATLLAALTHPLTQMPKANTDGPMPTVTDVAEPQQDQEMTSASPTTAPDQGVNDTPGEETTSGNVDSALQAPSEAKKAVSKKSRDLTPPDIAPVTLRLVSQILTARDCSSKTFRDTLTIINNLSAIPDTKQIFRDELLLQASKLGQQIHKSLSHLVKTLAGVQNEMQAQSLALAEFSPNGSDQVKLSRILTALDYLYEKAPDGQKTSEDSKDVLADFHEDKTFLNLWQKLSDCLSATQGPENYFFNVATILLPLIEALMVVCKRISLKDPSHKNGLPESGNDPESETRKLFFSFTSRHRKILNDLVRHNTKLMSGSFSVLVKNSGVLEFDNKRNFFTRRLHHRSQQERSLPHPSLQLNVRRDQVFLDSYKCLHYKSPAEIKYGRFNVRFHNEEGVDAGGVTREWFQVLARQMFNPDYALFNPVASDRTTFHPNSLSGINQEHLRFFKFIGRMIGKALYENRVLDCHFSRAVYKRILGKAVSIKDMETVDLDYSKNMEWMLNNDITDIITETFSETQDKFGVEEVIDLLPDGRNVAVTEENKHEYVRLVIEYRLTGSVKDQLESFLEGFHDIVPAELISVFDEGELELLISGMPDVDVDDWKNNTEYHNYNASSPQIQWLWRAIRSFDKEEKARLLQFVTGAGKVPLNGFKELEGMNGFTRFSVHKDYGDKDRLPSSHTCFNQLDLPEYDSYEHLRKALYTAMTTGNEYFGYA
ncbi:MAG: hypothetical protein M1828_005609 [Chrysothrix sp. TS-e1954]|nr:MAG: hypothetical protein M1828_005609 [Chrysothrix sp. TS-e1954]